MDWNEIDLKQDQLIFDNEDLVNLTEMPKSLPNLRLLYINAPNLKTTKGFCQEIPNLEELGIFSYVLNEIVDLPKSFPKLRYLSIRGSFENLEWMPKELPSLDDVNFIDLKFRSFKGMPKILPKLKALYFSYNGKDFEGIALLPIIDRIELLDGNIERFQGLPLELPQLKKLIVPNNHISSIIGLPNKLPLVEKIDLSKNQIQRLEGFTSHLPNLKTLELSYNQLPNLHGMPVSLPILEEFYVNNNILLSLEGMSPILPKLRKLELVENQLLNLKGISSKLPVLKELHLDYNPLETFIGFPEIFPQDMIVTVSKCPIRSLTGLPRPFYNMILRYISPDFSHFSETAKNLVQQNDLESLYEYYQDSPLDLSNRVCNGEKISEMGWERLGHEGGPQERQLLERVLPTDHPVIQKITERITLKQQNDLNKKAFFNYYDIGL